MKVAPSIDDMLAEFEAPASDAARARLLAVLQACKVLLLELRAADDQERATDFRHRGVLIDDDRLVLDALLAPR